jgi:hypothetical protein
MGFKKYIAALLVLLFLGKMISIDAKLLGFIYSTSEVTLVNKMCPKHQLDKDSPDEFAQADLEFHFELDYLCNVAFDFKPDEEIHTITHDNFKKHSYRTPGIFSISRDKFYPPPKV